MEPDPRYDSIGMRPLPENPELPSPGRLGAWPQPHRRNASQLCWPTRSLVGGGREIAPRGASPATEHI